MKVILEFGRRGGKHVDNLVFPSKKLEQGSATWLGSTHFVAVTAMDGALRGPASAQLWKEEK